MPTGILIVDDHPLFVEALELVIQGTFPNAAVSKAESIRSYRILPKDFSIEGGELTPTLKVKRAVVAARYETTILEIYSA